MSAIYKGFTFKGFQRDKSFVLTDVELVKQDLRNHIFTRRGSRVVHRGFGTNIEDLIFEPFTEDTTTLISDQVRAVIDYDPRVVLLTDDDYIVLPDYENSRLTIQATLFFIEIDLTDVLDINLEFQT